MTINIKDETPTDAAPVGTVHRGGYLAPHIDDANRQAAADPHRPIAGQTIRLTGSRLIVVIAKQPVLVASNKRAGQYTWQCEVAAASPFQAVIHQQIEVIESSLRRVVEPYGPRA